MKHIIKVNGLSPVALNLCYTSNARSNQMSLVINLNLFGKSLAIGDHMWPGSYNTHVTNKNIKKLWKLINATSPQKFSQRSNSRIVNGSLFIVSILIHYHTSELKTIER